MKTVDFKVRQKGKGIFKDFQNRLLANEFCVK